MYSALPEWTPSLICHLGTRQANISKHAIICALHQAAQFGAVAKAGFLSPKSADNLLPNTDTRTLSRDLRCSGWFCRCE